MRAGRWAFRQRQGQGQRPKVWKEVGASGCQKVSAPCAKLLQHSCWPVFCLLQRLVEVMREHLEVTLDARNNQNGREL